MARKLEEITVIFLREFQRWDETIIAEVKIVDGSRPQEDLLDGLDIDRTFAKIRGQAAEEEFQFQQSYRLYGRWDNHARHGWQFAFQTFVRSQPHGQAGTIRYLMEAPHIGHATADVLWKKFGGDAVRVLRETPEVAVAAVAAKHFTPTKAAEAAEWLSEESALEGCTIDLIDLLHGRGFPKRVAKFAVQRWGNQAAEVIRRCPYYLMEFSGCGFLRCDAMYLELGGNPQRLKRQALCAWHALASDAEGHTWYPVSHVEQGLRARIGGPVQTVAALKLAKRAGIIATRRDSESQLWLADAAKAGAESRVAECVAESMLEADELDRLEEQLSELEMYRRECRRIREAEIEPVETEITEDEARQHGHTTGKCIFCGRELKTDESKEVGYGPICAARNGLPWGIEVTA